MKRYNHFCSYDGGGPAEPQESPDGEWVRWEDVQALAAPAPQAEPVYDRSVVARLAMQMGWTPPSKEHIFMGLCPDDGMPDSRDPECPACRALTMLLETGASKACDTSL